jgi:hypothetical protein
VGRDARARVVRRRSPFSTRLFAALLCAFNVAKCPLNVPV